MQGMYSMRSPAVKRLMKEAQELSEPTEQYHCQPLEDNLFEWHFTIRGPAETEFEGGVYHGRIILPPDYPMKPPSIILLTHNGRFEVNKKICLSISGHHPESWQPSWSIRTALLAIIGFLPTHGSGALGSLDYPAEERKILAKRSLDYKCPNCGPINQTLKEVTEASKETTEEAKHLATQMDFKDEKEKNSALKEATKETQVSSDTNTTDTADTTNATEETHSSTGARPKVRTGQQPVPIPGQFGQFPMPIPPHFGQMPMPMPFMPPFQIPGNLQNNQQRDSNILNQVPRFPLPFAAHMSPPFPPFMNPMMPGMNFPMMPQGHVGTSPLSPSNSATTNAQVATNSTTNQDQSSGLSAQQSVSSNVEPSELSRTNVASSTSSTSTDTITTQSQIPSISTQSQIPTSSTSDGLRQRSVPVTATTASPSPRVTVSSQPRAAPILTRTSQRESPVFIMFAVVIMSLIVMLLLRRLYIMKYFAGLM